MRKKKKMYRILGLINTEVFTFIVRKKENLDRICLGFRLEFSNKPIRQHKKV
ncbi:hypothetical protein LEP1GSC062_1550 [Leptospira alexanderi serovar Manhao 3 str. L 60]|uniref:Uncharacterized protein n=1 Tax=Leptospira alexanderi serovar Manhao 3 str. L 60 TaxID=1049759 RepID=V6HUU7_9LEPT|nr:hypothetical protein LEP1GSC062_1550 [Leptospira alexanderi serovar Manhao 3 str. L 60]